MGKGERIGPWCFGLAAVAAVVFLAAASALAQEATDVALVKATMVLRHIDQSKIPPEERRKRGMEIQQAWQTLTAAGDRSVTALKQELQRIDKAGERDDFFKLSAAGLLWKIGGLNQAETIAGIWETTPIGVQYNYTFLSALEAARTQDPRALPMLRAILRDKKGEFFVMMHSMNLTWPLTHEFIWGVYGPGGLPALTKLLETSKDSVQLESCIWLLAHAQHLDSLESIRRFARSAEGDVRRMALRCLGFYGHPSDYDILVAGAGANDPEEAFMCVAALYDYGDLRAVDHLVALLNAADEKLSDEVQVCLGHLLNPVSFEALKRHLDASKDGEEKTQGQDFIRHILGELEVDWATYSAKDPGQKAALFAALRESAEDGFRLSKTDRTLNREQFLEAATEWKKNHRITGGKYEWVKSRHVLSVATPDDIPLLLEVKASVLLRVSDECLYETHVLDDLVQRLGRSRYRKVIDVCEKVELK